MLIRSCPRKWATANYVKKNVNIQTSRSAGKYSRELFGYIPAVLKEYKDYWRIKYYVKYPISQQFVRRREKVTIFNITSLTSGDITKYVHEYPTSVVRDPNKTTPYASVSQTYSFTIPLNDPIIREAIDNKNN